MDNYDHKSYQAQYRETHRSQSAIYRDLNREKKRLYDRNYTRTYGQPSGAQKKRKKAKFLPELGSP
jgi:hypothetical protein